MHRTVRPRPAVLVALALLISACGGTSDDADTISSEGAGDATEINSEGHGDGEHEGHGLAVGANTPKDPKGRFYLHVGDTGPDVSTLQERLNQLGADLGAPDGIFGDESLLAVMEFQRAEGLDPDGVVGTATWAALDSPTTTDIDWSLPEVPEQHSTEPVPESSGELTAPPTTGPAATGDGHSVGSQATPSNDPAAGKWSRAVVTLSDQTATFYDAGGAIVFQAPISSGKNGLTPTGTFHVQSKSPRAYAGSGGVYMDSMTRFNGGIGFHSIPKRASGDDLPTPLGQAPVSHGCIRMADANAKLVFDNLPIGAIVEVH